MNKIRPHNRPEKGLRDQVALSIGEALIFLRGEAMAVGLEDLAQSLSHSIDAATQSAKVNVSGMF